VKCFDLFENNVGSNYFGANISAEEINYLFSNNLTKMN
jgi:hypothetical protein